jgi:hypothetical protein
VAYAAILTTTYPQRQAAGLRIRGGLLGILDGFPLGGERRGVGVHLGLQRLGQHPPGAFPDDLINQRRRR